ncbi:nuclear transport factor 2 family protein [Streptomyces sp. WMMC1477]|uniref:nuclear transport factor 2 family protein n=1 Tax=Streptomyces sp. WMMC1477 TaxID=3015155 RepID=UPI0022B5EE87|nr:nuclear transport factor 2 family protein [Streptomyces sp. WMMC1477]MCZ7434285.1 nuclear transport factor 2 family protein [Streptomyces sp. WMMC1477]
MTFHYDLNARLTGHSPTAEERASLEAWFAAYDTASGEGDVAAMGDAAVFPLNLVSDDSSGNAWTGQWDREQFTATMTRVMGEAAGGGALTFTSERTPVFLSPALVVVFTRSTMTVAGEDEPGQEMTYADILVRSEGTWAFQTMIQGGWGDMLNGMPDMAHG